MLFYFLTMLAYQRQEIACIYLTIYVCKLDVPENVASRRMHLTLDPVFGELCLVYNQQN
jgi:hypothetical protein